MKNTFAAVVQDENGSFYGLDETGIAYWCNRLKDAFQFGREQDAHRYALTANVVNYGRKVKVLFVPVDFDA